VIRASRSAIPSLEKTAQPAVASADAARLPEFFIVGHGKSGTTSLYEMLSRHPQLHMPFKEPWFFASELRERMPPRREGIPRTLEEYRAIFAGAAPDQVVGEASPQYLWSRTAAERIAQVQPDARIVAIFREPAGFLHSLHLQLVEAYIETETSFPRALELEDERRLGRRIPRYTYWPQMLLYSEHVRYVEQLRRYHAVFPREQVLVLIYDDFRRDNEATVRKVLRFLDVNEEIPIESIEANPTIGVRSQRFHELMHAVSVGRGPLSLAVKSALKALTPEKFRRDQLARLKQRLVYKAPSRPDERIINDVRRRYAGEVRVLSEYIGRDLEAMWGYDRLT
jgi:Sulfotransferase family